MNGVSMDALDYNTVMPSLQTLICWRFTLKSASHCTCVHLSFNY